MALITVDLTDGLLLNSADST